MSDLEEYYNHNAQELSLRYESVKFEKVHKSIIPYLPSPPARILDIGAGSGRDSAWFARNGFSAVAVEPSSAMLKIAKKLHTEKNIIWVNDSLPKLSSIRITTKKFDLIFASAVLMHLKDCDLQKSIKNINSLLSKDALFIASVKQHSSIQINILNPLTNERLVSACKMQGLTLVNQYKQEDIFGRVDAQWTIFIFKRVL